MSELFFLAAKVQKLKQKDMMFGKYCLTLPTDELTTTKTMTKRRFFKLSMLAMLLLTRGTLVAQDENLKMHFDFKQVSGTEVTDAAGGIKAKLMNQAKVIEMGTYSVMDLGNGTGYLDMTAAAGALLWQQENFTISVYYRIDPSASLSGNGYFLWSFSQAAANSETSAPYTAYRLNAQRLATSTGGWRNETGIEMGTASDKGRWVHVVYRQAKKKGELFLDGKLQKTWMSMPLMATAFTAAPAYNWIGRAPFSGDNYLKQTLVTDFRLYDKALTDKEVKALSGIRPLLDEAYTNGGGGDATKLLETIADGETLLAQADNYPAGAVTMLSDALTIARDVSGKNLTQMAFDNYLADLKAVIAICRNAKGVTFDTSGADEGYSLERGFRHPGGLHTQADFDRIKQLLAEKNATAVAAYNKLKAAEYSRSNIATWPVETIVRGGGVGENYINAARGATMAYQNALRWKIDGTKANADGAVRILMAWARGCKLVSGDSNWALAAGLYGYQFAQAAELMRDYEGWSRADFEEFKRWMLTVWYPGNVMFLRGRNGTWDNPGGWGDCPGHYWSNWGLCNALAIISIGILCDDVYIYNQGMSFFKYDQVGTFRDPRTANPILNDGCTEFLGNLVVTTAEWDGETGAYGRVGQMQESGRDQGHACMALGLAVDIAQVGWNQGDDLWAYHDNRLAAGIEHVAAFNFGGVTDLPWTEYRYADRGTAWHGTWN
jgi:hypothetical protein